MKKLTIAAIAAFALSLPVPLRRPICRSRPSRSPRRSLRLGTSRSVRPIASDYIFRGVTQSNHKPSVAAYFEPRYNVNKDLQLYAGIGGASIGFPNRAAAEIDFYARRPPDLRQALVRFRLLVLLLPGRPVLQRRQRSDCSPSGLSVAESAAERQRRSRRTLSFSKSTPR